MPPKSSAHPTHFARYEAIADGERAALAWDAKEEVSG